MSQTDQKDRCREYRIGTAQIQVWPEVVMIALPYGGLHEDFVEASMFVERYTHAADGTSWVDDTVELEFWLYPNIESLANGRPALPPIDPRVGFCDQINVVYLPEGDGCAAEFSLTPVQHHAWNPFYSPAFAHAAAQTEQFVQEMALRAGCGIGTQVGFPLAVKTLPAFFI